MTREEAGKMAKAALECMEREVSGCDEMCNSHKCDECALNYEKGNMGEQKEWLRLVIKALEHEPKSEWQHDHEILKAYSDGANDVLDKIRAEIENHCGLVKENHCKYCSYCNSVMGVREIIEIIDKYRGENEGV